MQFRELRIEASRLVSDHAVVDPGLVFRWTAHHVREIFCALLPRGFVLDGSSIIQLTCGPRGEQPQYTRCLGSSEYFVERFDFVSYATEDPATRERIILATVQTALCDIANRVGAERDPLERTIAAVMECGFHLSIEVPQLRKVLRPSGCSLRVFRCLSSSLGETWLARVVRRDKAFVAEVVMGKSPNYLDRRDHFKVARLIGDAYVVHDRFENETFRLDVAQFANS